MNAQRPVAEIIQGIGVGRLCVTVRVPVPHPAAICTFPSRPAPRPFTSLRAHCHRA